MLADLLDHSGAGRNPLGRLDVERNFEVQRHRAAATGTHVRLGHGHAGRLLPRRRHLPRPADRRAGDRRRPRQARASARRIGPVRSIDQWWKWVRGTRRSDGGAVLPTLYGRIQTRIFLLARRRRHLDAAHHADAARSARRSATAYRATFVVLAHRARPRHRLGVRLPRPPAVPLGEGLADAVRPAHRDQRGPRGVAARARRRRCRGCRSRCPTGVFLVQFLTTWLLVWLVANGPMRVPFVHWRFRGGRLI